MKDGYLADLLLVDGDPLANLSILRDPKRILAVMKDGVFAKAPEIASQRRLGARRMTLTRKQIALWLLFGGPIAVFSVWALADNAPLYFKTLLNGLTLASLYFLVASGFTLVFGLMRNVNLAHGSLYLLGAYVGWIVGEHTGSWVLGGGGRLPRGGGRRPADAGPHLPPHAGAGPAPDAGDDRPVDRLRRPDAVGLRRRDLHLRSAGAGSTARPSLPVVEKFPTYRLAVLLGGHRDRRGPVELPRQARASA